MQNVCVWIVRMEGGAGPVMGFFEANFFSGRFVAPMAMEEGKRPAVFRARAPFARARTNDDWQALKA